MIWVILLTDAHWISWWFDCVLSKPSPTSHMFLACIYVIMGNDVKTWCRAEFSTVFCKPRYVELWCGISAIGRQRSSGTGESPSNIQRDKHWSIDPPICHCSPPTPWTTNLLPYLVDDIITFSWTSLMAWDMDWKGVKIGGEANPQRMKQWIPTGELLENFLCISD